MQLKPPFRAYDPERDREATHRIWREVGWLKKGREEAMDRYVRASRALVAEIDGTAECLVLSTPGSLRYLDEDLPFACVIGVTTSYIARRQKLAGRLAARLVAADALDGALVTALGMFEQGFYNKLGFGTGTYEIFYAFDPAHLRVPVSPRVPCRITPDDWEEVHA
ncbi:MAG TPA: GNAT family N-acetyltransferase, partial [Armatimonadota bacterium]|nr:GNAT family N-acetyltransferase [Armatimonadota bacterium]